ncbi:hypothetical protein [Pseudoalteromonas denitrificans]|uniref:DUF2946 domain-containing protein n=1 Tax=Pseudoalteromonas denitrificans DSM 6059 TaxID=1123010 RepID=A0A1I1FH89_9GAMM|nr:hypothetical protein [Pseudoalteromonas denitrificans]SFB98352.1 hypothetical protein SAMN02745724_00623 [Pseudoalteromonas denitrificans DSM 6059]
MLKTRLLFLLVTLLMCQPVLDIIDVQHHNEKLNQTSQLLSQQSELDSHCEENKDHQLHDFEHKTISQELDNQNDCSHCYSCHVGIYLPQVVSNTNILFNKDSAQTLRATFNSQYIDPEQRPPIS